MDSDKERVEGVVSSRRKFLGAAGILATGGVSSAIGGDETRDSSSTDVTPKGIRWGMVIDLRKCTGCHTCSVACKSEMDVPLGVWNAWVKEVEVGEYPNVKRHFLPRLCNHCQKPPCVKVCPTTASHVREDGIVQVDGDKCISCKLCISACPYNARYTHPDTHVAAKCNFCIHRVDKGLEPSCVNGCPMKARTFGNLNDPESEVSKLIIQEGAITLKSELGTQPSVYYIAPNQEVMGQIKKEV